MENRNPALMIDHTIEEYDQATPHILTDTPYLAHSLTRTARLWSWLHPTATHAERVELLQIVAREMGVAECIKCPV